MLASQPLEVAPAVLETFNRLPKLTVEEMQAMSSNISEFSLDDTFYDEWSTEDGFRYFGTKNSKTN